MLSKKLHLLLSLVAVFDCGSNLTLENGMVRYISEKTTLGSVAIFICNNDYRRNGNANRTCELSGWSGSNPTCGKKYDVVTTCAWCAYCYAATYKFSHIINSLFFFMLQIMYQELE